MCSLFALLLFTATCHWLNTLRSSSPLHDSRETAEQCTSLCHEVANSATTDWPSPKASVSLCLLVFGCLQFKTARIIYKCCDQLRYHKSYRSSEHGLESATLSDDGRGRLGDAMKASKDIKGMVSHDTTWQGLPGESFPPSRQASFWSPIQGVGGASPCANGCFIRLSIATKLKQNQYQFNICQCHSFNARML